MTRPSKLDDRVVQEWIAKNPHWDLEDAHLVRYVKTTDYPSGARIVQAQVALAERLDHHPVINFAYRRLRIELWTHDRDGVTQLDLAYAEGLDSLIEDDFADFVR